MDLALLPFTGNPCGTPDCHFHPQCRRPWERPCSSTPPDQPRHTLVPSGNFGSSCSDPLRNSPLFNYHHHNQTQGSSTSIPSPSTSGSLYQPLVQGDNQGDNVTRATTKATTRATREGEGGGGYAGPLPSHVPRYLGMQAKLNQSDYIPSSKPSRRGTGTAEYHAATTMGPLTVTRP